MKSRVLLSALVASLLFVMALAVFWTPAARAQIPDTFTNLKVLPQDISKKELIDVMKDFTFALGTRCWYCHEGEGDDLSTFDFRADTKPAKEVSREHIRMTSRINEDFFSASSAKVNCNTCHQGLAKPES